VPLAEAKDYLDAAKAADLIVTPFS
jgi:hypothetical protein